jgi:hypothetical protein
MVNYSNGKVYMIEPIGERIDEGDIYIGSTTKEYLSQRMDTHRSDYRQWKNGIERVYTTSFKLFDKYGVDNCRIILLESVNCKSKDELLAREGFHIKSLKCINKYIPIRTKQQYYEDNKEKILEQKKQYRKDNIEKISKYKNQYYQDNKEKIIKMLKEKFNCECGSCCNVGDKQRHFRSIKHKKYIESLN